MKSITNLLISGAVLCAAGAMTAAVNSSLQSDSGQDSPRIVGSLLSATGLTAENQGLYSFAIDNPADRTLVMQGPVASYGGVVIDGVYYCNTHSSWFGMFNFYDVFGYDLSTGQQVMDYDGDDATAYFAQGGMNLDPISGDAIGIFYDEEMQGRQLALVSYSDSRPTKNILASLSDPDLAFNAFAVDGRGGCWAISMEGDLYSIDRHTGDCTLVGPTGFTPYAVSGAVIDPDTDQMYWTLSAEDGTGSMVEVNLSTGVGTRLYQFSDNAQWNGLYLPEKEAAPNAPGKCTDLSADFPGGSMNGTLTLTTPSNLYNGEPGSGPLSVAAFVNGIQISRSEADWGAEITIDVDLDGFEAGQYDFMVYAFNEAGNGPRTKLKNVWIGTDFPSAPSPVLSYADGMMTLSWDAVTTGANGGVINPDNVRYTIYDKYNSTVVSGLAALSYAIPVEDTETARSYRYMVKASANDMDSKTVKSNTIVLGLMETPYEAEFTEEGIDAYTIIDGNGDGIEWSLDNESPIGISIHYSEDYDMDDWLISPPLYLEAGKAYAVSFSTYSMESYYAERIEVKWGNDNTAEAMTESILEPTLLPNMKDDPFRFTRYICPPSTGRYFIGFHGISDKDKFDLILAAFSVSDPISAFAPAKCTDLSALADPTGLPTATIGFTVPELSLEGGALSENVSVDIYRNGDLVQRMENLNPGTAQSFIDEVPQSGEVIYRLVPSNSFGPGEPAEITAYVGFHNPQAPASATISRTLNQGEVSVEWSAVTHDVDGLEFPAGSIVYDVYLNDGAEPVATGITNRYYIFEAVDAGSQDMVSCRIYPRYGILSGEPAVTGSIPVGTPYDGLWETGPFGNYVWGVTNAGGAAWNILEDTNAGFPPSYDNDGTYFGCSGSEADDFGILFSGLISLENLTDPALDFATYHISGGSGSIDQNKITVSVKPEDSDEWSDIWENSVDRIAGTPGEWGKVTIPLASFRGQVIQVQFTATCVSYPLTIVDGIHVYSGREQNLSLTGLKTPARVVAGKDFNVEVEVTNIGGHISDEFEIRLYADDSLIETRGSADLEPAQSMCESFTLRMPAIAEAPMKIYAEVYYDQDEDLTDNKSGIAEVEPRPSTLPAPRTLIAERSGQTAVLEWEAPASGGAEGEPVTEDFEDAGSFCSEFGDWIFIDMDGSPVGGLTNTNIPGIVPGQTKDSFWIWDTDVLPIGGNGNAHSGSHYLFSLFRYDNKQSDEWAISPELSGEEQTISFWAKSYSSRYPEHLQVLTSAGGSDPSDFSMLEGGDISSVPGEWTRYEMVIPAGTRYFALRNYAAGAFMLMIDDVTYIPAATGTTLELIGYNVYRNGELVNESPVTSCSWTDSGLDSKLDYLYQVTALYEGNEESGSSNKAIVKGDDSGVMAAAAADLKVTARQGCITIENPEGIQVSVYTPSGIMVYTGRETGMIRIPASTGIYVVSCQGKTRKITVR